jgi:hypothetical protein
VVYKDTVMPDDTVTTSWKRFTDRVKTSCDQSLHATLAPTSGTTRPQKSHPDSLGLGTAVAACPTYHDGEAVCQTARLATREAEGGMTVFAD